MPDPMDAFMPEIVRERALGARRLRLWATDYGTHVGATVKLLHGDATHGEAVFVEAPFEAHWQTFGTFSLRQGRVTLKPGAAMTQDDCMRACIVIGRDACRTLTDILAATRAPRDVFAAFSARADDLLAAIAHALDEPDDG